MNKNFRILFVDDEAPVLNGIRRIFQARRSNWELVFASSGKEAIQKVSVIDFDLIVTDGKMPGMSGSEMLREMKVQGLTKDIPTIMLTGYVDDDMRKEALECGIIEFVNKPVIPDEFVLRIENVLNFKMMHDELKTSTEQLTTVNSELNRLYEIISTQKKELEELNEMKSQFIEIAMNEFRSSTKEISEYTSGLRGLMNPETDKEKIVITERIIQSVSELSGVYRKIVNISDITTGTLKLNYSRSNVLKFFNELIENSSHVAEKKNIKLISEHDNILPVENYMDTNKIWIAVSKLLENAVKFSETTNKVDFGMKYSDNMLKFIIKDYGIGMNDDQMRNLFSFNNSDNENKQGVSLPLVKKIIDAHKGNICVESKFGGGTKFTVSIPVLETIPGELDNGSES